MDGSFTADFLDKIKNRVLFSIQSVYFSSVWRHWPSQKRYVQAHKFHFSAQADSDRSVLLPCSKLSKQGSNSQIILLLLVLRFMILSAKSTDKLVDDRKRPVRASTRVVVRRAGHRVALQQVPPVPRYRDAGRAFPVVWSGSGEICLLQRSQQQILRSRSSEFKLRRRLIRFVLFNLVRERKKKL